MRHLLLSLALVFSSADTSLQNVLATQTTYSSTLNYDATLIPTPTKAPCANDRSELRRRAAESISPNLCGWFVGGERIWQYNDVAVTCFWNSDYNIVGNAVPQQTACVEQADFSTCTDCSGDDVLKCLSASSYCLKALYGLSYSGYMCHTEPSITWTLKSTPDGMTAPIAFPVYTGRKGISTGIQYPSDYPIESRTIPTSSYSLPESTESTESTESAESPISTPTNSFPGPSTTPSGETSSKSSPVGAIVGGVIGGVFLIALIVGIVFFLLVYSRRNNQNLASPPHQPPQNGFGNPQVNPYPTMQQYYPPPNNPQGAFASQGTPNQHGVPPQQPANPEQNLVNQQGFNQAAVSHIQPNQQTPSPQQITAPELHGNQVNANRGISPSELSPNQSAVPQQQPTAPELHGNQPNVSQGGPPSELDPNQPTAVPQHQSTQPELDSRPANQAYLQQVFASNGQHPQMRDGSTIHEAP